MFTSTLEKFSSSVALSLSHLPGIPLQSRHIPRHRRSKTAAALHTVHTTEHARTAATPFPSNACAQFPSHRGCTPLVTSSAQFLPAFSTTARLCIHSNARNSNPFKYLLHSSLYTWGGGVHLPQTPSTSARAPRRKPTRLPSANAHSQDRAATIENAILPSTFNLRLSTLRVQSPHLTQGDR